MLKCGLVISIFTIVSLTSEPGYGSREKRAANDYWPPKNIQNKTPLKSYTHIGNRQVRQAEQPVSNWDNQYQNGIQLAESVTLPTSNPQNKNNNSQNQNYDVYLFREGTTVRSLNDFNNLRPEYDSFQPTPNEGNPIINEEYQDSSGYDNMQYDKQIQNNNTEFRSHDKPSPVTMKYNEGEQDARQDETSYYYDESYYSSRDPYDYDRYDRGPPPPPPPPHDPWRPPHYHRWGPPPPPPTHHHWGPPPPPPHHHWGPPPPPPPPPHHHHWDPPPPPPPRDHYRSPRDQHRPPPRGPPPDHRPPPHYGRPPPPRDRYGPPPDHHHPPPPPDHYWSERYDHRPPPPYDHRRPPPHDDRGPPPRDNYGPPPRYDREPPPRDNYGPPPHDHHRPPPHDDRGPPPNDDRRPPPSHDNRGTPPHDYHGPYDHGYDKEQQDHLKNNEKAQIIISILNDANSHRPSISSNKDGVVEQVTKENKNKSDRNTQTKREETEENWQIDDRFAQVDQAAVTSTTKESQIPSFYQAMPVTPEL